MISFAQHYWNFSVLPVPPLRTLPSARRTSNGPSTPKTTVTWTVVLVTGQLRKRLGKKVLFKSCAFWVRDEASDAWAARQFKGGRRLTKGSRQGKRRGLYKRKGSTLAFQFLKSGRKERGKPLANPRGQKESQRNLSQWTGPKEKASLRPSPSPTRDQQGKAIPQKRQAFPKQLHKTTNGKRLLTPHNTRPGKPMVPTGAGRLKLAGKSQKLITKTGRTHKTGNLSPTGLPCLSMRTSLRQILRAVLAARRAA